MSPSAIGSATVTVTAPSQPVLSSIAPGSGNQGASVAVTLTGSNFAAGATLAIGGTGVSASNVMVVSATKITATFVIAATAATGAHSVTVNGASGAVNFTVNAPTSKPTLTSISPNAAGRGATVNVTLTGTKFSSPATVSVQGSAITVSNVVVVNATTITATFRVSSSATRRSRDTTVTTGAGASNAVGFTVQ